jgi:membrane protein
VSGGSARRSLAAFWQRAYKENITGMAAMVAYNLMLSVFPFALLVLFIFGQILQSGDIESTVLRDLEELFPSTEQDKLQSALDRVQDSSTEIGIVAVVAGLWIGSSFWGAMDTAFCRLYLVLTGVDDLPFGLSSLDWIANLLLIGGSAAITFAILSVIYSTVPKGRIPWRGVWPGALFVTIAGGLANVLFPAYLVNLSTIGEFGRIVSFVLVGLIWFYVLALGLLAGAVINALRYELHDTGTVRGMTADFASRDLGEEQAGDWEPQQSDSPDRA